jgi:hypothetical protein
MSNTKKVIWQLFTLWCKLDLIELTWSWTSLDYSSECLCSSGAYWNDLTHMTTDFFCRCYAIFILRDAIWVWDKVPGHI